MTPRDIGPDEVACDNVASSPGTVDVNSVVAAPSNHVPFAEVVSTLTVGADSIAGSTVAQHHAATESAALIQNKARAVVHGSWYP